MQTQAEPRIKMRVPCDIGERGARHSGMVLNLSQHGLFVQTRMSARPGAVVGIDLKDTTQADPIPLQASVVWKQVIPRNLVHVTQGGMGLRIQHGCRVYDQFFRAMPDRRVAGSQSVPEPARQRGYRVRLRLEGGPRSRVLVLSAASEKEACQQALVAVGEGWTILEIDPD